MSVGHTVAVMRRSLMTLTSLTAVAALLLGACSDDSSDDDVEAETDSSTAVGDFTAGQPEVPEECSGGVIAEIEERGEPEVTVPEGGEPEDLVEGEGDEAAATGSVRIHYVLAAEDGTVVESSWAAGSPRAIELDSVYPGFGESIAGMKVGGRRAFTVRAGDIFGEEPPDEAGVQPDDQLVFIVDLVATASEGLEDADARAAADERGEPDVEVPAEAPEELEWADDVVGEGAVVCPGATVLAHYKGIDLSSGETFDSSWEGGEPLSFPLDGVIEGWSQGLVGMKVGGRRTLVIPGELAYGASEEDSPGQPTDALVFVVDLIGVG